MNRHTIVASLFLALSLAIASNASAQWVETDWPNMATVRNIMVEGNNIYVGATQSSGGISYSSDEGVTWEIRNKGLESKYGISVHSLAHIGPIIFAAIDTVSDDDYIFCSVDSGKSWKLLWTATSDITSLRVVGTVIYAGTSKGLFLSIDSGAHWSLRSDPAIYFHALYPIGSTLFAYTKNGFLASTDNGKTFNPSNIGIEHTAVLSLATVGSTLFVGTFLKDGVVAYRSTDNGKNWTPIKDSFSQRQMNAVIAVGNRIFLGSNDGKVFFSDDLGEHWSNGSTGITSSSVMVFAATEKNLFDGTYAKGVWSRPLSEFTASDVKSSEAQKEITVFPNPTTGVISINITSLIKYISITTTVGEIIREYSKIASEATIDLSQYPAGIYVARIVTDNGIEVQKIIKQ